MTNFTQTQPNIEQGTKENRVNTEQTIFFALNSQQRRKEECTSGKEELVPKNLANQNEQTSQWGKRKCNIDTRMLKQQNEGRKEGRKKGRKEGRMM